MAQKKPTSSPGAKVDDVVLVHGRSEDGKTLAVLRKRGAEVSAGLLTAAEEGKPVHGELLRLVPREDMPLLADVEVLHAAPRAERDGPAQVSTPAYRKGWEAIFGDGSTDEARARTPRAMLN